MVANPAESAKGGARHIHRDGVIDEAFDRHWMQLSRHRPVPPPYVVRVCRDWSHSRIITSVSAEDNCYLHIFTSRTHLPPSIAEVNAKR